ncbi:hypothetical protein PMW03_02055 [Clostridium paraputrificum]|uniref:hypothetical protein n=1 Tax=Clostridium paraputrificum TaxID=29363 RepID=UPI00189AF1C6|nr:hypothetical protein [Clostridium paraputrificum]MDB2108923.1 hypothetical protein [Clostridium paraputrificum]
MCKVTIKKILVEYLLYLLNNEKNQYIDDVDETIIDLDNIRNIIISSKQEKEDYVYFEINNVSKTRLLQYVVDKQLEIGFVNEDYLNEEGKNLQRIYDEIYYQTN